ncbi:MAG: HlyD family efflux transporter periplasmic adaptor subunit [Synergistaceae bacterium]|nr:HlyD family efflux transporter periplasmic adaptor subunit [Synergistaceae bacterium]
MKLSNIFKNKKVVILLLIIALACAGYYGYKFTRAKDTRVKASGTVEVTEIQLAPLVSGRLIELPIEESDVIKEGDLVARLSMDGADHEADMASAALSAAREQLRELQNGARREDRSKAEAELALRRAQYEQAAHDSKRFNDLAKDGAVSVREAELYRENAEAKRNAMRISQETVALLKNGARVEQIEMAKANVKRAEAALAAAQLKVGYKEFRSPVTGTVLTKNYEIGDVVSAGAPIATLGKMNDCWIKLYIPSTQLGLVKLGGEATVKVDAYPKRAFKAKVTEVNQQAEYNPRLSLTQNERANMVFWIKVTVENPDGVLKPGMPADVVIK